MGPLHVQALGHVRTCTLRVLTAAHTLRRARPPMLRRTLPKPTSTHTQLPQQRPDCTTALTSRWPIVGVRACVCSQGRETRRKHGYQVVHTHRSHNLKRQLPIPTHRITCQWSYSSTPSVFWKKFTILVSAAARGMLGQNKDGLRCPVRSVLDVDSTFAL